MPYNSIDDLPANVQHVLPEHAQEIFMHAFNAAHDRKLDESVCFKTAWTAVKSGYEKNEQTGLWEKKKK
jgi:cation transport regulator